MNDCIEDLRSVLQNLEDAKMIIEEQEEEIRQTISLLQMTEVT